MIKQQRKALHLVHAGLDVIMMPKLKNSHFYVFKLTSIILTRWSRGSAVLGRRNLNVVGSHQGVVHCALRPEGGVPYAKNQARMKTIFLRTRQE
jgi:hypothetical protein